ncbi:MAG: DUF5074 domain-containing protein, partial [Armatimonadota bacterium]
MRPEDVGALAHHPDLAQLLAARRNELSVAEVEDVLIRGEKGPAQGSALQGALGCPQQGGSGLNASYSIDQGENGVVKVIDLTLNTILRTIKVGTGPEQTLVAGGNILVCNGGAYDLDSTISVINPANDKVVQTITVGDNPKEMVVDKNSDIWVICYGYIKYDSNFTIIKETPSKLVRLSGQDYHKVVEYIISQTQHPQHIDISKDKSIVYYGGGFGYSGIYAMSITATSLPAVPFINNNMFYGFNVNPVNDDIYALDAGNFTDAGT